MRSGEQFVFGYGLLAAGVRGRRARLEGYRRVWGVAMDNRVDIPGYKSYRRRDDGSRPAVYVAFLDGLPVVTEQERTLGAVMRRGEIGGGISQWSRRIRRSSGIRLVTRAPSRCSMSARAYLREVTSSSRSRATVIAPSDSTIVITRSQRWAQSGVEGANRIRTPCLG